MWAGFLQDIPEELKYLDSINFCLLDVTQDSQVQAAIAMILKKDGRIDVLINNAGYGLVNLVILLI